jgi:hypothetical protein
MKQVTTQSLRYVKESLIVSKQVTKVVVQDNGVLGRRRCLQERIKKQAVDTDNGVKKVTEKFKEVDQTKVGICHKR